MSYKHGLLSDDELKAKLNSAFLVASIFTKNDLVKGVCRRKTEQAIKKALVLEDEAARRGLKL